MSKRAKRMMELAKEVCDLCEGSGLKPIELFGVLESVKFAISDCSRDEAMLDLLADILDGDE